MTISSHLAAVATTKLAYPGKVPIFYLPLASLSGGQSGPAATRSKYNLALAFVEGGPVGEAYLQALAAINRDVLGMAGRIQAVISLPLDEAQEIAERLALPFALIADVEAATTRRLLPDGAQAALCVADRYGIVYYLQTAISTADLPPAEIVLEWLDFVQIQCPECTDGSDSGWSTPPEE